MGPPSPTERLRFTTRSVALAIAMLGLTLALVAMFSASKRVLGWVLVAAIAAALLHPLVVWLSRWMPRGLAVLVVALVTLGFAALTVYALVDNVARETRKLQDTVPRSAQELERSSRFAQQARDFRLADRAERFMDDLPARLRGGTPTEAIRATATRGVAFLATGVLTLFFLLHGPRLAGAGLRQVDNITRRATIDRIGRAAYARTVGYVGGSLLMALGAALFGYLMGDLAGVPGPAPLGVWVGLWDIVPLLGAAIGAAPVVLLAAFAATAPRPPRPSSWPRRSSRTSCSR